MTKKRVVAALLASTGLVVTPIAASANAYGIEYWTAFRATVEGIPIPVPKGQLFHGIQGKGSHIDVQGANYLSASNLCDASVRFTYGNNKQHVDSSVQSGCSLKGSWKYKMNFNVPRGSACAELWSKNWKLRVARQCHYVSP